MKINLDSIKITDINYTKNLEILNWPNSFNLFRWESILSMYFNFIEYEYIRSRKDEDEYMILVAVIEPLFENLDPYTVIDKYHDYLVVLDIKKSSKGPSHKEWMVNIIKNESEKNKKMMLVDDNFLLEKIKDHTKYFERYDYYVELLKIKRDSKIYVKYKNLPFNGNWKLVSDKVYTNLNNSVSKTYFNKHKLIMYGDHVKINGAGILYNLIYYLKLNDVQTNDIHICMTFTGNNMKFFIEIINENANLLDNVINTFYNLSEKNYMEYEIFETVEESLRIQNVLEFYNMIDCKKYTLFSRFS